MVCKKCGNEFIGKMLINGVYRNLYSRKYCLDCSPYGLHNTSRLDKSILDVGDRVCICTLCSREYVYVRRAGNSTIVCNSCYQIKRQKKLKAQAIAYKGGKCIFCGYSKCMQALEFHHVDPSKKHFNISGKYSLSWDRIKDELDKCVLVCANCHRELDAGMLSLTNS